VGFRDGKWLRTVYTIRGHPPHLQKLTQRYFVRLDGLPLPLLELRVVCFVYRKYSNFIFCPCTVCRFIPCCDELWLVAQISSASSWYDCIGPCRVYGKDFFISPPFTILSFVLPAVLQNCNSQIPQANLHAALNLVQEKYCSHFITDI
jgi:hypothetical protein